MHWCFPCLSLTLGNNFLLGERRDYRDFNHQERIPIASTIEETWDYENNLRVIIPGLPVDVSVWVNLTMKPVLLWISWKLWWNATMKPLHVVRLCSWMHVGTEMLLSDVCCSHWTSNTRCFCFLGLLVEVPLQMNWYPQLHRTPTVVSHVVATWDDIWNQNKAPIWDQKLHIQWAVVELFQEPIVELKRITIQHQSLVSCSSIGTSRISSGKVTFPLQNVNTTKNLVVVRALSVVHMLEPFLCSSGCFLVSTGGCSSCYEQNSGILDVENNHAFSHSPNLKKKKW